MENSTLNLEISNIVTSCKYVLSRTNTSCHVMVSGNLTTSIVCNYELCSNHLGEFTSVFNALFRNVQATSSNTLNVFILEDRTHFCMVENIFNNEYWSKSNSIEKFNLATHETSSGKNTADHKYFIIKCYDHFYYIFNTISKECLLLVKNEKKAITMINILLLTPYISYDDLYAIHGGLVNKGGNNILLTNASLGGKTTFALLFLENGWQIATEETTYISRFGEIFNYNIRNYFNIRVGTYLEFKELFKKYDVTNDIFLGLESMSKNELFELGKKEQMLVYFDKFYKKQPSLVEHNITHTLVVSLHKAKSGIAVKNIHFKEVCDGFLKISNSPTVGLFKDLLKIDTVVPENDEFELFKILNSVKTFNVASGLDYRNNFPVLLEKINLIN